VRERFVDVVYEGEDVDSLWQARIGLATHNQPDEVLVDVPDFSFL
jgi:hypothetical protein